MRYREIIAETRKAGEYVYHASFLPDPAKGFRSILAHGLKPSRTGYAGPGLYFAYEPEGGYYHVIKEEATMFRVRWADLVDLYGVYPKNPKGIERDDDEIIVPGLVPAKLIEVEYFPGEWWDLESAYRASLGTVDEAFNQPYSFEWEEGEESLAEGEVVSMKDDPSTIKRLARQWWTGNPQELAHAQQMLNRMGWDISAGDDDIIVEKDGQEYVLSMDELEAITESWQKANKRDHTDGMSQKAVDAYRREHPGSKLQTAVTTKPSKIKPGSKDAKRRKSFCARMSGNKGPMKKPNGEPTPKALALRRWNCESVEQMIDMIIENMDHSLDNQAVPELKAALLAKKVVLKNASEDGVYDIIDTIMTRIAKSHGISGQQLHDMWVDKYDQIPDTWIMK